MQDLCCVEEHIELLWYQWYDEDTVGIEPERPLRDEVGQAFSLSDKGRDDKGHKGFSWTNEGKHEGA